MFQDIKLSENQKKIVDKVSGSIYVKASAGSGKTRVLTERIKKLLNHTEKKILALTFTNKAADEMKKRFENLGEEKERIFFGTMHGFCKNIIEQRYNLVGFKEMPHIFEDEKDRASLIEEAINLTPFFQTYYKNLQSKEKKSILYNALEEISNIKRNFITEEEFLKKGQGEVWLLYRNYQDVLFSLNAIDFDDLLLLTYRIFVENENINKLYKRQYEYICIDEAQDLNKAQYNIIYVLGNKEKGNVMMVGDPNQSIFGFNGSSSKYVEENFIKDFNAEIIKLEENYRSAKKVLKAANKLIGINPSIENIMIDGEFILSAYENDEIEALEVVKKVNSLIEQKEHKDIEGIISYEKICILARNKYVFKEIELQLKQNNVPYHYKMSTGKILFESDLMKMFELGLKVKLNPEDRLHWEQLCTSLEIEYNKYKTLEDIVEKIKEKTQKQIIENLIKLVEDTSNFDFIISELDGILILNDNVSMMFKNDIALLKTNWSNYAKVTEYRTLVNFRNSMALGQNSSRIEEIGVTLSTIHTMKGQEFDIVFLIGVDEGTFPDYRAVEKGGLDLEEEKNNLYVAFTRAKRLLYVSYPKSRKMPWGNTKKREKANFLKNMEIN